MKSSKKNLRPAEKAYLLESLNSTEVFYPKDKSIVDLFEEQVAKTPENLAVKFGASTLTYAELNWKSNQFANYISSNCGVICNQLIGVELERGDWMIIAILATLKLGYAYVPIDPEFPEKRKQFIIDDAEIEFVINQVEIDKYLLISRETIFSEENLGTVVGPSSLMYVIYTSGSTGNPKGCKLSHEGLVNRLTTIWKSLNFGGNERVLQSTNFTFDVSLTELIMPLIWGASVIIVIRQKLLNISELLDFIESEQITSIHAVPGLLNLLIDDLFYEKGKLNSLRRVVSAGEALPKFFLYNWYTKTEVPLYNYYGPTEASIYALGYLTEKGDESIHIGKPLANTKVYILDEERQLVANGDVGEIYLGGVGLAKGYINRPELNESVFLTNPFLPGEFIYKTGDLGRWRVDGNLDFLGRIDSQVKIRGYRIELGEVEHAIRSCMNAGQVVVTASVFENDGEKALIAYKTGIATSAEIESQLKKVLPEYMIPNYIVNLDQIPLLPSGKVDFNSLPKPDLTKLLSEVYISPETQSEKLLTEIWSEVLKRDVSTIGIRTDFFGIGGDSIRAIRIIGKIQKLLGVKLTLQDFFLNPTVETTLKFIESVYKGNEYSTIPVVSNCEVYPLSPSQKLLWVTSQFEGANKAYLMPYVFKLNTEIDLIAFESAYWAMLDRHEVLRTVIVLDDSGLPNQKIIKISNAILKPKFADLSTLTVQERRSHLDAEITRICSSEIDISLGPLVQCELFKEEESSYCWVLLFHHLIGDGWSTEVFLREFSEYYFAYVQKRAPKLDSKKINYKDFSVWQIELMKSDRVQTHRIFWLDKFKEEPPTLEIPTDVPRPQRMTFDGDNFYFKIDSALTGKLNRFSNEQSKTIFLIVQTAFTLLLNKLTGLEDIVLGTTFAGRDHPDLDTQIGFFVNTLPLRFQFKNQMTIEELFELIKSETLEGFNHQLYPYDSLLAELNLQREASRNPLFDYLIMAKNEEDYLTSFNHIAYEENSFLRLNGQGYNSARFDLTIEYVNGKDSDYLAVNYKTTIYTKNQIEKICKYLTRILDSLPESRNIRIVDFDIMSNEDKNYLLKTLNQTSVTFSSDKTLVDLFEEKVTEVPSAIAVRFGDIGFSYNELNEKSNQFAHYLQERYQIKVDDLVGIELERSELMVMVIFGILKSGAAYVPIDPKYPASRKKFIISDAKLKIVVDIQELEIFANQNSKKPFPISNPISSLSPSNLAYVIYTSGSTGNPKGCMLEHRGLVNRLEWMQKSYCLTSDDRIMQKTTYTFDVSVWELTWWAISGASVCILEPGSEKLPENIIAEIERSKVSVMHFVPSMLSVFTEYLSQNTYELERLFSLKQIYASGEALQVEQVKKFKKLLPEVKLMNLYGPTEASIDVSFYTCENALEGTIPIGKPIDNTSLYIINSETQELVPFGSKGEICIGGIGLARGYLNRSELTAEKFIENPFIKGERIYRTGDLGRWREDGNMEYLGRIDDQVKIKGFRIELGEIENVLAEHPQSGSVLLLARQLNSTSGKELVAYYTGSARAEKLKAYLKENLPYYMVPNYYVKLKDIPLMSNGKADKKSLPIPTETGTDISFYVEPLTTKQIKLAHIWSDVLKSDISRIGLNSDFFELGGDSIKSIQVSYKLRLEGLQLRLSDIMLNGNFRFQSELIQELNKKKEYVDVAGKFLLAPMQQTLLDSLFFELPDTEKWYFHQSNILELASWISLENIITVWDKIIAHHDTLRLKFFIENGQWYQEYRETDVRNFLLDVEDLSLEGIVMEGQSKIEALSIQVKQQMDLKDSPNVFLKLFKYSENNKLLIVINHLVVDTISWNILLEDLNTLFGQIKENKPLNLSEKTDSYKSWVESHSTDTFKKHLHEKRYNNSEINSVSNGIRDYKAVFKKIGLGKVLSKETVKLISSHSFLNINSLFVFALKQSINEFENLRIFLEGHGREESIENLNIERTVGWFTSLYPIDLSNLNYTEDFLNIAEINNRLIRASSSASSNFWSNRIQNLERAIVINFSGDTEAHFSHFSKSSLNHGSDRSINLCPLFEAEVNIELSNEELIFYFEINESVFGKQLDSMTQKFTESIESIVYRLSNYLKSKLHSSLFEYAISGVFSNSLKIQLKETDQLIPCNKTQKGLYSYNKLFPDSSAYSEKYSVSLSGPFNLNIIKKAFEILLESYPVLTSNFLELDSGNLVQIFSNEKSGPIRFIDLSTSSQSEIDIAIEKFERESELITYNLERDALYKLTVIKTSESIHHFVWTQHHIILDGWSNSILISEFFKIYSDLVNVERIAVPRSLNFCRSYYKWQNSYDSLRAASFWRKYLSSVELSYIVPKDKKSLQATSFKRRDYLTCLPFELVNSAREMCGAKSISITSVLNYCWSILLAKYTNKLSVTFGTVVSGRNIPVVGIENEVGLFINTIPITVNFSDNNSHEKLVKDIIKHLSDESGANDLSFNEILNCSDFGQNLIDHVLVFENFPDYLKEVFTHLNDGFHQFNHEPNLIREFNQSNFDFSLAFIFNSSEGISIKFVFNENKVRLDFVQHVEKHLINILRSVVNNFDNTIGEIDLLDQEEYAQIFDVSLGEKVKYDTQETYLHYFQKHVFEQPQKEALIIGNKVFSYKELDQLSNQFANYLQQNYEINGGDLIPIKLKRSEWFFIAVIAIHKIGAAYVPVDPMYPESRIEYIINDVGALFVIDDFEIESFSLLRGLQSKEYDDRNDATDSFAYCIYTSGSTGNPKGVLIEHSMLLASNIARHEYYGNCVMERGLLLYSFAFDSSVNLTFKMLISGGTIILYPENEINIDKVVSLIDESSVDTITIPPGLHDVLLEADKCISLRNVIVAGEECRPDLVTRHFNKYPDVNLFNEYGPTECTVWSTVYKTENRDYEKVPIGRPIANVGNFIMDQWGYLMPLGLSGELCIVGPIVGKGYLNNLELTNKKFIFSNNLNEIYYKTGDNCFWNEELNLVFNGRLDNQVKIRGYRVELGEIEATIASFIGIHSVFAAVNEHNGDKQIVCFYTGNLEKSDVFKQLRGVLPDYMVPASLLRLDEMPLTPHLKVDKNALFEKLNHDKELVDFLNFNEKQKQLADVWASVLKKDLSKIGFNSDFFNLGGDSIKAIMLISKLRMFDLELKISEIMDNSVFFQMYLKIKESTREINQGLISGVFPLLPMQKLFFGEGFITGDLASKNHFLQSNLFEIDNTITKDYLHLVFVKLFEHHDSLRAKIVVSDNELSQIFEDVRNWAFSIDEFDFSTLNYNSSREILSREIDKLNNKINFQNGPTSLVALFTFKNQKVLYFTIHHLFVDLVSWRVLVEDLNHLMDQILIGQKLHLSDKTDSTVYWIDQVEGAINQGVFADHVPFWDEIENQVSDRIDSENCKGVLLDRTNHLLVSFDEKETSRIKEYYSKSKFIDIEEAILFAVSQTFHQMFGLQKIKISLEGHGRDDDSIEANLSRTVGWFTNAYPILIDFSKEYHYKELVDFHSELQKIPNNGISYGWLKYFNKLNCNSKGSEPLIDFNYHGEYEELQTESSKLHLIDFDGFKEDGENLIRNADFLLNAAIRSNVLSIDIAYHTQPSFEKRQSEFIHLLRSKILNEISLNDLTTIDDRLKLKQSYPEISLYRISELHSFYNKIDDIFSLTPMQKGLHFLQNSDIHKEAYFEQFEYIIKGSLDIKLYKKAFSSLFETFDVLRVVFSEDQDGKPIQIVKSEVSINFSFTKVTNEEFSNKINELKLLEIQKGFNLTEGPLLRMNILYDGLDRYFVLWSSHHIILDGWSMAELFERFKEKYAAMLVGLDLTNKKVTNYGDYVRQIGPYSNDQSLSYWKKMLDGYESEVQIPGHKLNHNIPYSHSEEVIELSAIVSSALREICIAHKVTLNNLMQAIWGLILSKYNNSRDVVFGSIVSGRNVVLNNVEGIVGLLINIIPVRISYSDTDTFVQLARRVQADYLEGLNFHFCHISEIQNQHPLRETLISHFTVFENYPENDSDITKELHPIEAGSERVSEENNYDFSLIFEPAEKIKIKVSYNKNAFEDCTIINLKEHWKKASSWLASNSQNELGNLEVAAEFEITHLNEMLKSIHIDFPSDETVISLFEKASSLHSNKIAIIFGEIQLSYTELNAHVNDLAKYLQQMKGISQGDFVSILLPRGEWTVISILAIIKCGGIYVPIDLNYPNERIEYIKSDSRSTFCIDDTIIQDFKQTFNADNFQYIPVTISSEDSLYVIYTSGTTGKPKGSLISHRNVVRLFFNNQPLFDFDEHDTWVMFHSYCFDFSVWEMYGALLYGGKLVIPTYEVTRDVEQFLNLLNRDSVTILNQTPSAFYMLDGILKERGYPDISIKKLIFGGEALNPSRLSEWHKKYSNVDLINMYGITETTVHVTYKKIEQEDIENGISNIGTSIPTLSCLILGKNGEILPYGAIGEIHVIGEGLSKGYLNKPDLTNERFVFNSNLGLMTYKSGDLGRYIHSNEIEYFGRIDSQVKVRGHRIELSEIEKVALENRLVKNAHAIINKSYKSSGDVVLYIVGEANPQEIREFLNESLPDYMVPAFIIQLDIIPLNNNGKVDRNKLPLPSLSVGKGYFIPETEVEIILSEAFSEVLKLPVNTLAEDISFIGMGGDSIRSIQVISKLRAKGYKLKVADIMKMQSMKALASKMEFSTQHTFSKITTDKFSLSPIQYFFFEDILLKGNEESKHFYNQTYVFDLSEKMTKSFIEDCLYDLICHHDTLRIKFEKEGSQFFAKYQNSSRDLFLLKEVVISSENNNFDRTSIFKDESEKVKMSLNLLEGPLISVLLLQEENKSTLLLSFHHLIIDLVSWRILIEDLNVIIAKKKLGERVSLPEKGSSYYQWIDALQKYGNSRKAKNQIKYWNEILSNPGDKIMMQLTDSNSFLSDYVEFEFRQDETIGLLNSLSISNHVEINSLLLYAIGLAAKKILNLKNVRFNIEGHGREEFDNDIQINRTVGWFTSLFPFNLNVKELDENLIQGIVELNARLNNIPDKGFGFGLLMQNNKLNRYGFPDYNSIEFNYMGAFDSGISKDNEVGEMSISLLDHGPETSSGIKSGSVLSIGSMIFDGKFSMKIWYDKLQLPEILLKDFSCEIYVTLKRIVSELQHTSLQLKTANEFNFKNISPRQLMKLEERFGPIEDIMRLTPVQSGIYFHAELDNDPEMYFVQFGFLLKGISRVDFFVEAIKKVLIAYEIPCRIAFSKEIDDLPLQILMKPKSEFDNYSELDFEELDISELDEARQREFLQNYFVEQRKIPFNLSNGNLIRIKLLKIGINDYYLLWNNHHIILDGWSTQILLKDIYNTYARCIELLRFHIPISNMGASLSKENGSKDYRQYIDWLDNYDQDSAINFWNNYLKDYEPVIDPFVSNSAQEKSHNTIDSDFVLEEELTSSLYKKASEIGVTVSTLFQGLWSVVYSKYCDSDDVVFGIVTSGRPSSLENIENIVGALINTVPLRVKLNNDDLIIDHLRRIEDGFVQVEPYQFIGLSDIQIAAGFKKPFFSNAIVFENYPTPSDDSLLEPVYEIDPDWNHVFEKNSFNLSLIVLPEKALKVILKYNANAISELAIENIKRSFTILINDLISDNQKAIKEIAILDIDSQLEIVKECTLIKSEDYDYSKTIIDHYYGSNLNEDDIAIIFKDKKFSYSWLECESNRFASYLRFHLGINPNEMVAVQIPRSEYMPVVLLGILKNRCAYVPISLDQPNSRTQFILEDSKSKTLITTDVVKEFSLGIIAYPKLEDLPAGDELMYCLYTSGSTGQPKGCLLQHHSLLNRLKWMQEAYFLGTDDVILQKTPFTFDVSVWELFWWLMYGAKINLIEQDAEKNPEEIIKAIEKNQVTVIHFVPSMLAVFLDFIESSPESVKHLKSLKQIFTSGEALLGYHVRRLRDLLPTTRVMNLYGPTEASIDVSYFDCKEWDGEVEEIPIGRPIFNTGLLVLNKKKQILPLGSVGEISISGVGLAQGYLNRPELTAQKFITHPIDSSQKIYLTGDLGRWNKKGQLEYFGRIDDQVKIRGNRIELGEITSKILAYDGVKEAIVIAKKIKTSKHLELIAYVVGPKAFTALKNYLSDSLPSYMVPTHYVSLENIPLSGSGKADIKQLPDPENSGLDVAPYISPSTEMQIALAAVWATVLQTNLGAIGVESDFFDLGGDSIKAIQMVSKLRAQGLTLKLAEVISKTTLKQQAQCMKTEMREISQKTDYGPFSLSPLQHLFLEGGFMDGELEDKHHFNQSYIFELPEWIDQNALTLIFDKITSQHDALRLRFKYKNNTWLQEFAEPGPSNYKIQTFDCKSLVNENLQHAIIEYGAKVKKANELLNGPIVNIGYFLCADGDRLLVTIHHLAVDMVSWQIIQEDLNMLFLQKKKNKDFELPLKTDSFKDWIQAHKSPEYISISENAKRIWANLDWKSIKNFVEDNALHDSLYNWQDFERLCLSISKSKFNELARKKKSSKIDIVLLYVLSKAMNETFGSGIYGCYVEKHGRLDTGINLDVTRTVGWFTDMYPVLLNAISNEVNIGEFLSFHDKIYMQSETNQSFLWSNFIQDLPELRPIDSDFLEFNFLGEINSDKDLENSSVKLSTFNSGPDSSQNLIPKARIIVVCGFVKGYLKFNISASSSYFSSESIYLLLKSLEHITLELVDKLLSSSESLKSAADFSYNQLEYDEIKLLEETYGELEDVYELSPMQKGLYYLGMYNQSNHSYCVQFGEKYQGNLSIEYFKEAVIETIRFNPSLKAIFTSSIGKETLQIIPKNAEVDFEFKDLSKEIGLDSLAYCMEEAKEERGCSFDFNDGKLVRIKLFKLNDETFYFLWTNHHIILDGWSTSIILAEIRNRHNSKLAKIPYADESKPLFSNYISWLSKQDSTKSMSFWKQKLQGYSTEAEIKGIKNLVENRDNFYTVDFEFNLSENLTKDLETQARKLKTTMNTIMQAAYGLLLSHYCRSNDVLFGAIVSGRTTHIPDIQKMVGLLFNTIPLRVRLDENLKLSDLFFDIQKYFLESQDHHYLNVADFNKMGLTIRNPIRTLLTFENYPTEELRDDFYTIVEDDKFIFEQTNYDLSTIIIPGRELHFIVKYNPLVYSQSQIRELKEIWELLLILMSKDEDVFIKNVKYKMENIIIEKEKEESQKQKSENLSKLNKFKK